ncbi:hypothetical protein [Sphaerospermopsis torques-reginae]|jgi:hypothetical protein|uniref:Uncharacterized protein n=1 Tax=Sphaerospermopsis torques-reginae ITEP-024 TaxID=984208 RepID=A0ABX8X4N6_9CYAN|nr:hypothetical protein [Sphaerospermopsis torques-reginae]QYX33625.1 hypothetical protein K2F26_10140 [Sphaerospermopsis torques-reginae ITEP-024]
MNNNNFNFNENFVEQRVTYSLEKDGQFLIVENVPARVNLETGEQFFSPDTVEQLQQIILQQIPVYKFTA